MFLFEGREIILPIATVPGPLLHNFQSESGDRLLFWYSCEGGAGGRGRRSIYHGNDRQILDNVDLWVTSLCLGNPTDRGPDRLQSARWQRLDIAERLAHFQGLSK